VHSRINWLLLLLLLLLPPLLLPPPLLLLLLLALGAEALHGEPHIAVHFLHRHRHR
jgi:hypothetical protein